MCTYLLALKDGAKVQGWQKTESGFVSFRRALGVRYGCVRGGIVAKRGRAGRGKKGDCHPWFGENQGGRGNKKKPLKAAYVEFLIDAIY